MTKEIILTDPFTGIDFTAVQYDDNSIVAIHPLTGESITMPYDRHTKTFMLPAYVMNHIETLSLSQAAKELQTSLQCVSVACKSGRIPFKKLPNGAKMIVKDDLDYYAEMRKVGRPRKENGNA